MTRTTLVIMGASAFGVGVIVGAIVATELSARSLGTALSSAEARYARAMFCYAPALEARRALEHQLAMFAAESVSSPVQLKERALFLSALASVLEKQGDPRASNTWLACEATCKRTDHRDCSRGALLRFAQAACGR